MKVHLPGIIFFATSLALFAHEDSEKKPSDNVADSPATKIARLVEDYDLASKKWGMKRRVSRRHEFRQNRPDTTPTAMPLKEIILAHPQDASVIDAARWLVDYVGGADPVVLKVIENHHINDAKIVPIVAKVAYVQTPEAHRFLKVLMNKSTSKDVRGIAFFALARRERRVDESIAMLEKVIDEHPELEVNGAKIVEVAKSLQWAAKSLRIGRAAPEIIGEDVDGTLMKLSDYRGKVVVLMFWGDWFSPSRMYAHQRSLVERMKDKPFTILGVNSDPADKFRKAIKKNKITWPSFWDGGGMHGPIVTKWWAHSWPTIYVLDANGVIRYEGVRGEKMDEAVDTLIAELES